MFYSRAQDQCRLGNLRRPAWPLWQAVDLHLPTAAAAGVDVGLWIVSGTVGQATVASAIYLQPLMWRRRSWSLWPSVAPVVMVKLECHWPVKPMPRCLSHWVRGGLTLPHLTVISKLTLTVFQLRGPASATAATVPRPGLTMARAWRIAMIQTCEKSTMTRHYACIVNNKKNETTESMKIQD